jgi:hypothetical protein
LEQPLGHPENQIRGSTVENGLKNYDDKRVVRRWDELRSRQNERITGKTKDEGWDGLSAPYDRRERSTGIEYGIGISDILS